MNAITATIKKVPVHAPRHHKVWLTPQGRVAEVVVPGKSQTSWDAYVLDTETGEVIDKFPRLKGEGTYVINGTTRPTEQIGNDYLRQVKQEISAEDFAELENGRVKESLTIATIVNSTKPL